MSWPSVKVTRRGIQISLGCLWIFDGLLQLQSQMFTANFVNSVLAPAALGQPGFVSGPIHFFTGIFLLQPALFNTFIAVIQLGLGVLILLPRTNKIGLIGSAAWALFVWYVGEGLGGLANGQALMLMGAPGAALIYALLALGAIPRNGSGKDKTKTSDQRPAYWLMIAWVVVWVAGAVYQLLPRQNTVSYVSSMILGNAHGAPAWLAALDKQTANIVSGLGRLAATPAPSERSGMHMAATQMAQTSAQQGSGFWFIMFIASIQLAIGLAVVIPGRVRKTAVGVGIVLSLIFWIVGQSLGSYFSGSATDLNTGPLVILLGIVVLSCTHFDAKLPSYFRRFETLLIGPPHEQQQQLEDDALDV